MILDGIYKYRVLCHNFTITENIYEQLKHFPDYLVLTVTRQSASSINNIIIAHLSRDHPLALVVSENNSMIAIPKGMTLMLTRNINKSIGFVNGQFVIVLGISNSTLITSHRNGHVINVFPITSIIDDIYVMKYPCLPGYTTTSCKVQGQTSPRQHSGLTQKPFPRAQHMLHSQEYAP